MYYLQPPSNISASDIRPVGTSYKAEPWEGFGSWEVKAPAAGSIEHEPNRLQGGYAPRTSERRL